ncbi:response regulator [Chitinophaga oryzae]|uniref:Response regulator n=1 Tax=Chitinophaga oryzae TaxID=2725414 RepID=A0AAE6ZMY2_9BACT|nr:response regulator [Chitinophaga oryzae]QJB34903.1 response regulator [Chitinophaga oryzae]QJB41414.1 response regulator [Chitinophaga oryzae]
MSQIHKVNATSTLITKTINAVWIDDDNFFLKWLIPEMFKIAGTTLKITEFTSAVPAIERIKTGRQDIVLTNLFMPPPDGMDLIKMIREFNKKIPIVVVSARFNPKLYADAISAGAIDYFFKKDLNLCDLCERIDVLTSTS